MLVGALFALELPDVKEHRFCGSFGVTQLALVFLEKDNWQHGF